MNKFTTKYFGEINSDKDYYETEIKLNGRTISLDLNINLNIDIDSIKAVENFIDNLTSFGQIISSAIEKDFKSNGITKEFIEFHTEEFEKEEIEDLIKNTDKTLSKKMRLLSVLYPKRIGFYPDKEDQQLAIWDYVLNEDLSDELLVIIISKKNEIEHITWES